MNKAVFLDRDGVINKDYVDYVWDLSKWETLPGVEEGLKRLKDKGYHLIVVTNQSGIAKGIYTMKQVRELHDWFNNQIGGLIDAFYFAPYHENHNSMSFTRKPGSMMIEKGMAKFAIDSSNSWMIGDKERDLIPGKKMGLKTALIDNEKESKYADFYFSDLNAFSKYCS